MKFEIGIIGLGFVGGAVLNAYKLKGYNVHTFDVDVNKNPTCQTFEEFLRKANVIYVAVPTPMTSSGACDTSILESVVHDLCMTEDQKVIIIKSTVPPGTTEKLQELYPTHHLLFNPEFLTEANYLEDYLNQDVLVVGKSSTTPHHIAEWVLENQVSVIKSVNFVKIVSSTAAELLKYTANTFLAMKVSFANELYDIAEASGIAWEDIRQLVIQDKRLGKSHWMVPGPDGLRGAGGTCVLPDTKIITPTGDIEIQHLNEYDEVLSVNEELNLIDVKKILEVIQREYDGDLYEFDMESGTFTCTPDHLIPVVRDGISLLIPAKDVRLTDLVYTYKKE